MIVYDLPYGTVYFAFRCKLIQMLDFRFRWCDTETVRIHQHFQLCFDKLLCISELRCVAQLISLIGIRADGNVSDLGFSAKSFAHN
jgi:hypothetical protein